MTKSKFSHSSPMGLLIPLWLQQPLMTLLQPSTKLQLKNQPKFIVSIDLQLKITRKIHMDSFFHFPIHLHHISFLPSSSFSLPVSKPFCPKSPCFNYLTCNRLDLGSSTLHHSPDWIMVNHC